MLTVGLTGGIGAGKSTVAAGLAEAGAVVVDADRIAREVVEPGSEGLAAVVERFGSGVLDARGGLDRAALARRAFADDASRLALEAILHPRIAHRSAELVARAPATAVVVHDVPLLVEKAMGARYHLVLVVDVPEQLRVERLVEQRGMTRDDAWGRVRVQADDDRRRAAADVLLDNSGAQADVLAAVDDLWRQRLLPFEANVRLRRPAPRPADVRVVGTDPTWPEQAARLAARVGRAAGDAALRIDHVGSTAVPGLPAPDVLDLQLLVPDLESADALQDALADAGFVRAPGQGSDDPDGARHVRRVHVACDPGRAVDLHVRPATSHGWRVTIMFRDWLRANPGEVAAYADVTRSAQGVDGQGVDARTYLDRTGTWVEAGQRRAQVWASGSGHPLAG